VNSISLAAQGQHVNDAPPSERPLSELELGWVQNREAAARDLVAFLLHASPPSTPIEPTVLDQAFREWRSRPASPDTTATDIVTCLGCAFGQFLVARLPGRWLVVNDSFGTELAVRFLASDLTTFPLAVISKRLNSPPEELAFFEPIFHGLTHFPFPKQVGG
jgi:hypothetical protein